MTLSPVAPTSRAVYRWLMLCAALVALMVAVGGYTRLSGSGLSISEWKPVHGVIPPLSEAEWEEEFAQYRAGPQYAAINKGMTLDEFKKIYWPEYTHRLLGRIIGAVFFLPLVWFWARGAISKRFGLRLAAIFALGGAQGMIGWIMVQSGLTDQPYVSHVKLALHLGMAFILFGLLVWSILDVVFYLRSAASPLGATQAALASLASAFARNIEPKLTVSGGASADTSRRCAPPGAKFLIFILLLLFIQIVFGAFLAGLHGGLVFNTFPTMNGQWMPDGIGAMKPWWDNLLENITTIQFIHRWLAVLVVTLYIAWWAKNRTGGLAAALALLQFALGVATLLHMTPLPLALAHQMNALALFGATVVTLHGEWRNRRTVELGN